MASIFEWFDRRAQMEQALTERGVTNPPERGQEENTEPKDSLAVRPPKEEESLLAEWAPAPLISNECTSELEKISVASALVVHRLATSVL